MIKSLVFTLLGVTAISTAVAQFDLLPLEWAYGFGSERWEASVDVAADNSGNVINAGFFGDPVDFDPGEGEFILTPVSNDNQSLFSNVNGYIQKLDGNGNFLWAVKHLEGVIPACCLMERKTQLIVSPDDYIFALSNVTNAIDLDPGPETIFFGGAVGLTWVIQKFDPNGNLVWAKTTNMSEYIGEATAIEVDSNGDFFLSGMYNGFYCTNLGVGCSAIAPLYSSGNLPFISKLDGDTGDLIWVRAFESPFEFASSQTDDADIYDIAVDQSTGNVAIAGWFENSLQVSPSETWFSNGQMDAHKGFVITMDGATGQTIWAQQFADFDDGFDTYVQDIDFDGSSRLYARGRFPDQSFINFGYDDSTIIFDNQGEMIHTIFQDPSQSRERNTILHVNNDGSFMLSGMHADDTPGRLRHQANVYNSDWDLSIEYEITGPFYIYSNHWANATMNENGALFFAGAFTNADYDANPDPSIDFIIPVTPCPFTSCTDMFIQKVDPCSGSNSTENVSICAGNAYTFPDGLTTSNIQNNLSHVSELGELNGCNITLTTNISVLQTYSASNNVYLCSGDTYTFPDGISQAITESTSQTLNFTNTFGCDSTLITNITVEVPPVLSVSYDCNNDELLVDVISMGTFQGNASPPWLIGISGLGESILVENPGLYTVQGVNANQSYRLNLFEPNNCALDYFIYPNCVNAACGENAIEKVANGNFDIDNDFSWTETSTFLDGTTATGTSLFNAATTYDNSPLSARFGGFNEGSITTLEQDVYLPASTEITELTWWQRFTGSCNPNDVFTISLGSTVVYSQSSSADNSCGDANWHKKSIDISNLATGTLIHLTMTYTQSGTNGASSLFVDNVSILSCPCQPNIENQTIQICPGDSYTFPNGVTYNNITEPFQQYSYFSPPPCITGIITSVELLASGCTDPNACNFDPAAVCDDGNCLQFDVCGDCGGAGVAGCVDTNACNYNATANCDDGSCYYNLSSIEVDGPTYANVLTISDFSTPIENASYQWSVSGGVVQGSGNENAVAILWESQGVAEVCLTLTFGVCPSIQTCTNLIILAENETVGCTDELACNYNDAAVLDDGTCTYPGCTDPAACNYSNTAGCDDGSCAYEELYEIIGLTTPLAFSTETYTYTETLGSSYEWLVQGGTINSGQGTASIVVQWAESGVGSVAVTESTELGCIGNQTIEIAVDCVTTATAINGPVEPTEQMEMTYSCNGDASSFYQWEIFNGIIVSGQGTNTVVVVWSSAGSGNISVVETTDTNCMGDAIVLEATIDTGLIEISDASVAIFPNPASNSVTVSVSATLLHAPFQLHDARGRLVVEGVIKSTVMFLKTSQYLSGCYTFTVIGQRETIRKQIILQQ